MFDRKKIITGLSFFLIIFLIFLFVRYENKKGNFIDKYRKGDINTGRVEYTVAKRGDKPIATDQELLPSKTENVEEFDDSRQSNDELLRYQTASEEEIKEAAYQLVNELYKDFTDMDFSHAVPGEMIFVNNTKPGDASLAYYVIAIRNAEGEMMARAVLNLLGEKEGKKILEAGNVEPFPPAYSDPWVQEEYRQAEKYPLTDNYPRISEEEAFKMAKKRLKENYSFQGLTNLFVNLPSLDFPYEIGVPFNPYYKFTVEGDEGKTIWINSESGFVVDYDHLDSEMERFEEMMLEEGSKPPPPEESDEENND